MTTQKNKVQKATVVEPERMERSEDLPVFVPATNILAREDGFVLTADMPGVERDRLDIKLEDNVLTIRGETRRDEPEGYELLYRDYEPGVYERSFTLSAEIDQAGIQAQLKNGVLRLVLPKSKAAQPRHIKVEAAE